MNIFSNISPSKMSIYGAQPHYKAPSDLRVEYEKCSDLHQVSETTPSIMAQSWSWDIQIAIKKQR